MNINKITQPLQPTIKKISKFANSTATKLGEGIERSPNVRKIIKRFEPNGGDNSFFGLATIMFLGALAPRIKTALKRNPDDKEATMDEIKEILFRDVQTIGIMLLGLKSMNSLICNAYTKATGIPVVDKAFKRFFNEGIEGFSNKAKDVLAHPFDKAKTLLINAGRMFNPIGGSSALSGNDIEKLYSNYPDIDSIKKLLTETGTPIRGGNSEKVFKKIKESIIEQQQKVINDSNKVTTPNLKSGKLPAFNTATVKNAQENIEFFKNLTYEEFMKNGIKEKGAKTLLLEFFNNPNNALAHGAKRVNSWLRTLALAIEVSYLGFGLPALNQKRLEKKYLSKKPTIIQTNDSFNPINDRHIKAQEIQLYSNFIK